MEYDPCYWWVLASPPKCAGSNYDSGVINKQGEPLGGDQGTQAKTSWIGSALLWKRTCAQWERRGGVCLAQWLSTTWGVWTLHKSAWVQVLALVPTPASCSRASYRITSDGRLSTWVIWERGQDWVLSYWCWPGPVAAVGASWEALSLSHLGGWGWGRGCRTPSSSPPTIMGTLPHRDWALISHQAWPHLQLSLPVSRTEVISVVYELFSHGAPWKQDEKKPRQDSPKSYIILRAYIVKTFSCIKYIYIHNKHNLQAYNL